MLICDIMNPLFISYFFFNDTATTEIYTYGHTLSHTTLFRSVRNVKQETAMRLYQVKLPGGPVMVFAHTIQRAWIMAFTRYAYDCDPDPARSEEHTSELQSLMRISYAVFCLKKKNKIKHTS